MAMSIPIPIHNRRYETEAFYEDDVTMRVRGRLVDTKPQGLALADGEPIIIHDMTIDLIVDADSFVIRRVMPVMDVHPYEACTAVLDAYAQLVGVSIARGYSRTVRELFGGPNGCSHIGALLLALGPVAVQARWSFVGLHDDPVPTDADHDDGLLERLHGNENTCHVWKSDGAQMTKVRGGERPLRPGWETERLVELKTRR